MKSKTASARTLILNALLDGQKLTTFRANTIGKTTEGGRRIRELREHYPIKKEQVPGESYYQYYLPAEYLAEHKKTFRERIGDFFDDLFKGGMFEEAKV